MSTSLYWEVCHPKKGNSLCDGIKWALQKEYGSEAVLTEKDICFLKGVLAAQFKPSDVIARDCKALIDAIAAHGTIRIWIE